MSLYGALGSQMQSRACVAQEGKTYLPHAATLGYLLYVQKIKYMYVDENYVVTDRKSPKQVPANSSSGQLRAIGHKTRRPIAKLSKTQEFTNINCFTSPCLPRFDPDVARPLSSSSSSRPKFASISQRASTGLQGAKTFWPPMLSLRASRDVQEGRLSVSTATRLCLASSSALQQMGVMGVRNRHVLLLGSTREVSLVDIGVEILQSVYCKYSHFCRRYRRYVY